MRKVWIDEAIVYRIKAARVWHWSETQTGMNLCLPANFTPVHIEDLEEKRETMRELYRQGVTCSDIAKAFRMNESVVKRGILLDPTMEWKEKVR